MKLKEYDVKISISDPEDSETQMSVVLSKVSREKVLTVKVPLAGLLKQFEEAVHEDN